MQRVHNASRTDDVWKGAAAGFIGGLAGSLAMEAYQLALRAVARYREDDDVPAGPNAFRTSAFRLSERSVPPSDWEEELKDQTVSGKPFEGSAPARLASRITQRFSGRRLHGTKRRIASEALHYGYGASVGAAYGALAEVYPDITLGEGSAFGAGIMVAGDEVAVPALGLSDPPHHYPPSVHINTLITHIVYGVTCELVRRSVRRML